jgi:hypothetical protein
VIIVFSGKFILGRKEPPALPSLLIFLSPEMEGVESNVE